MSSGQEDEDGAESFQAEDGHRESQAGENKVSWIEKKMKRRDKPSDGDIEGQALGLPVDGSHGPCDSDTEEHVDSVGAGNISNRVVCSLVFNGSCLGGKGIWGGEKRIRLGQCSGRHISPTPRPRATHLVFVSFVAQYPR